MQEAGSEPEATLKTSLILGGRGFCGHWAMRSAKKKKREGKLGCTAMGRREPGLREKGARWTRRVRAQRELGLLQPPARAEPLAQALPPGRAGSGAGSLFIFVVPLEGQTSLYFISIL